LWLLWLSMGTEKLSAVLAAANSVPGEGMVRGTDGYWPPPPPPPTAARGLDTAGSVMAAAAIGAAIAEADLEAEAEEDEAGAGGAEAAAEGLAGATASARGEEEAFALMAVKLQSGNKYSQSQQLDQRAGVGVRRHAARAAWARGAEVNTEPDAAGALVGVLKERNRSRRVAGAGRHYMCCARLCCRRLCGACRRGYGGSEEAAGTQGVGERKPP
jgi:hypothetical protein